MQRSYIDGPTKAGEPLVNLTLEANRLIGIAETRGVTHVPMKGEEEWKIIGHKRDLRPLRSTGDRGIFVRN